ncbi:hypothetical protein RclHR1_16570003 [Rhizophagus clarus]|uniref:Uncharacterized protein n=1 Tax=Rhizophagus clarus TaxID=94130 RepID=A0A2Z6RAN5_9GLOM|nr:hypothetical protein RclHR1_16570003 [Rhizophagus clarus]
MVLKNQKVVSESLIHYQHCRYYEINYYFFSRKKFCADYSWKLLEKHIQIPCTGQKSCKALEEFESIVIKLQSNYKARYICCECYEKEGGHLYVRPRRGNNESSYHLEGKYKQDLINSLELINKWVILSNNTQLQLKILNLIVPALQILNSENDTLHNTFIKSSPSLFSIKTIFKLYKININNSNLTPKECLQIGSNLAENLEKSRKEFKNFQLLESPNSLDEYQLALLKPIYSLFEEMVDFKEKSFTFSNIYDSTRTTTHATLRVMFQFELPISIELINDEIISLEKQTYLFGPNQFANKTLIGFQLLISQLLNCRKKENNLIEYSCGFDSDTVNTKIIEQINIRVQCLPPHIVIFEAGGNPNSDEDIFATCEKYIEDLELIEKQPVEIYYDKAIFRQVLKLHQKKSNF